MLGNQDFRMDENQLDEISKLIKVKIPNEYFAAMDYHLDWIYASLFLTQEHGKKYFHETSSIIIKRLICKYQALKRMSTFLLPSLITKT